MERRTIGFAAAARDLYSNEGLYGFFAGSQTYGVRTALFQRRRPKESEIMARLIFSIGNLRLPVALACSSLSRGYFELVDGKAAFSCFCSGFFAALFSCPSEALMRHSVCTHADRVTNSEKYNHFKDSPKHIQLAKMLAGLNPDPPPPEQYQTVDIVASASQPSRLFRGWPLDCTRFGLFFMGFSWTYQRQTGHYPNSNWIQDPWRLRCSWDPFPRSLCSLRSIGSPKRAVDLNYAPLLIKPLFGG